MISEGIHTDISIEAYHADTDYLSATNLKWARQSLAQFRYQMDKKLRGESQEEKSSFGFGNAFELALLDTKMFESSVAIREDDMWVSEARNKQPEIAPENLRRSKTYQDLSKKYETEKGNRYSINDVGSESYEAIEHMIESCKKDAVINRLLENVSYQLSLFWTDPETGIRLKTRPDICKVKTNSVINLKTTKDGSPEEFSKDIAKYAYPLQAVLEMRGCIATGLLDKIDYYFWLVAEKNEPYCATVYEFDKEDWGYNATELDYLLGILKKAQEANLWPGYSQRSDNKYGILKAKIPLWYKTI